MATKSSIKFDSTAIVLARKRAGLTQEGLARLLNLTTRAIQFWEAGAMEPKGANLLRLCELLELSANDLYTIDDDDKVAA